MEKPSGGNFKLSHLKNRILLRKNGHSQEEQKTKTYRKSQNGTLLFIEKWKTLAIAFSFLALVISEAPAGIVMFTHEGNGSGTLAGNPFPASDFIITAVPDTDDRSSTPNGWSIKHSWASISIDGVGNFDFLIGTRTFVNNNNQTVGFARSGTGGSDWDLFNGPTDAQFAIWDMLDPIGPISGSGYLLQWTITPLIDTTGGILKFDSNACNATFTAVPEPATVLLLGLGTIFWRRNS